MTQPAYRFLEDVPNISATGAMADLQIHVGGTEPIAAPFNSNNMIMLAVLANHETRLNSIDTIVSDTVAADETIFHSFTSDFVNIPQVLSDMKGSIFNWYDTLTSSGYSNYELYHKNVFPSGADISGGTFNVNTINDYSGGTTTIISDLLTDGLMTANGGFEVVDTLSGTKIAAISHGVINLGYPIDALGAIGYSLTFASGEIPHNLGAPADVVLLTVKFDGLTNATTDDMLAKVQAFHCTALGDQAETNSTSNIIVIADDEMIAGGTHPAQIYVAWTAILFS